MKVNVLGQININGVELQVYEFTNPQIGKGYILVIWRFSSTCLCKGLLM